MPLLPVSIESNTSTMGTLQYDDGQTRLPGSGRPPTTTVATARTRRKLDATLERFIGAGSSLVSSTVVLFFFHSRFTDGLSYLMISFRYRHGSVVP